MKFIREGGYAECIVQLSDGKLISADDELLRISGYTSQELADGTMYVQMFAPPGAGDEFIDGLRERAASGRSFVMELPLFTKSHAVLLTKCFGTFTSDVPEGCLKLVYNDCTERAGKVDAYDASREELASIVATVPGGVLILSVREDDLIISRLNNELKKLFDDKELGEGMSLREILNEEDYEEIYRLITGSIENNIPIKYQFKYVCSDGKLRWFKISGSVSTGHGESLKFYTVVTDVTHDVRMNTELRMQAERFKIIADNSDEMYFDYDVVRDVMTLNMGLTRYLCDNDGAIDHYLSDARAKEFVHEDDYGRFCSVWNKAVTAPCGGSIEFRTRAYDDDYTWYCLNYVSFADEHGQVIRVFGRISCIQNIKTLASRVDSDKEYIQYLLETDSLTGLLNRTGFKKHATEVLSAMDANTVAAVVYFDINDFSYVNDNFGYEAGNKMLREFALCMKENPSYIVGCRIYSDYYVAIYKAHTRDDLIKAIEQQNTQFTAMQKQYYPASDIRVACGIYMVSHGNVDITAAIDNANLARRSVKHSSSIICGIYSQRMRQQRAHEQAVCSEVHAAIQDRNIEMFLQPKFHLESRTIIGAEALARWRNPDGTYKLPYEFIPVLEKVGYIDELDFFIYGEALKTLETWKRDGVKLIPISVNFSQHHISQPDFVESLVSTADKFDVDKGMIEIEITESSFSGDVQALFTVMTKLRDAGFRLSIDDFGIGYSTLSVLINAPVDIVKVDKSFIDNIEKSKTDREFVSEMCMLISTAKKDIIFEGVETDAQARILSSSGYTKAQGWLFDKAIPLELFNQRYMYK